MAINALRSRLRCARIMGLPPRVFINEAENQSHDVMDPHKTADTAGSTALEVEFAGFDKTPKRAFRTTEGAGEGFAEAFTPVQRIRGISLKGF